MNLLDNEQLSRFPPKLISYDEITHHRAPYRVWRTIAILSVPLFLAVCAWGYITIKNL